MRSLYLGVLASLSLLLAITNDVYAAWVLNGSPACTTVNTQFHSQCASDGAGGVIIAWEDFRSISGSALYAQRLNGAAIPQWTVDGVPVNTLGSPGQLQVTSDGSGGVIITWVDGRNGTFDVFAQRLNASGVPQWTANGVTLCAAAGNQTNPQLVRDASNGAIVVWDDGRFGGGDSDIYAQRVNGLGVVQWAANGVSVCGLLGDQLQSQLASDAAGGAIIAWTGSTDVSAQRLNASGAAQWTPNGIPIGSAPNTQDYARVTSDGAGGAIIAWEDFRSGTNYDIYAQRVNASGLGQWASNGVAICGEANHQYAPQVLGEGSNGAFIAWYDYRSGNADVYVQRVSAAGALQWTKDGVVVAAEINAQVNHRLVSDGSGGVVITWEDVRNGFNYDVYAQHVNASGVPLWILDGAPVCVAPGDQNRPDIVSDGNGGAIVAWYDQRTGVQDVYAQRIEPRYGEWGIPEPTIGTVADNPADQGGKVIVNWTASDRDRFSDPLVSHYSLWRSTSASAASASTTGSNGPHVVSDPREVGPDFAGSAIWEERHVDAVPSYWEWVANQDAIYLPSYSYLASTRQDSVSGEPAVHYFKVFSHSRYLTSQVWESASGSGYSVDNLAPAAPLLLIAQRVGADVHLKWNRAVAPDLRAYSIYRATSSGVTPVPINFLASAEDTLDVDANAPSSALYYIVTALDVHDNQSSPSNEASVQALTGIGDTPAITALTVQNQPNPFTATTDFEIGLPKSSDVKVEVFDVAGRRVRTLDVKGARAGWSRLTFAATDGRGRSLASGVYFYRVTAGGNTATRKMVVTR